MLAASRDDDVDRRWMRAALDDARAAGARGEVPVRARGAPRSADLVSHPTGGGCPRRPVLRTTSPERCVSPVETARLEIVCALVAPGVRIPPSPLTIPL